MLFREMIINEDAGNLKKLPKEWLKVLTSEFNGLAGKKSEIILYKKNIKGTDISKAAKMVDGFVAPKDMGRYGDSQAEIEARKNDEKYAGVVLKLDDEFKYFIQFKEVGDGGSRQYRVYQDNGVRLKTKERVKRGGNYVLADMGFLKPSEIKEFLNIDNYNYDLYLVTADQERLKLRQKRRDNRYRDENKHKNKVLIDFLNNQTGSMVDDFNKELENRLDSIKKILLSDLTVDVQNDVKSFSNIEKEFDEIKLIASDLYKLRYSMKEIIKDGKIHLNNWYNKGERTYSYSSFKKHIKAIQDRLEEERSL